VPRVDPTTLLPLANRANDYLIDRAVQKMVNYSGIRGISEQDMAMTQSMGPIYERWNEHLGGSDVGHRDAAHTVTPHATVDGRSAAHRGV
jgi:hypothetical protein